MTEQGETLSERLTREHEYYGSWRVLWRTRYPKVSNHTNLMRYAKGDPVIQLKDRKVFGIVEKRNRIACNLDDPRSTYDSLVTHGGLDFVSELVAIALREGMEVKY